MKKEDILQTLSYLALKMENSGTRILEAIAPQTLVHMPKKITRESHRFGFEDEPDISPQEVEEVVGRIKFFGKYLNLNPVQASLMVVAFSRKFQDSTIEWDDVRQFFEVKGMVILPLKKDFDQLVNNHYLRRTGMRFGGFEIAPCVMDAVMNGKAFAPQDLKDLHYDRYKFVHEISDLIEQRSNDSFPTPMLFEKAADLEQCNADMTFVQQVLKLRIDIEERVLLYEICDDFLAGGETGINCTLKDMYESPSTRFRIAKQMMDERHPLQTLDLVNLLPERMFSETGLELTEKGKELFLEEDFALFASTKKKNQKLLYPDQIPEKQMFYDEELERQLRLFSRNLEEGKFADLQKRLEEKSMPKGIVALFHGQPGTGKTETAMQIARATGRAVCHVDISAAKTCWYGESQKLVKRIFTDYKQLCEKEKFKPILLFNEADALLSNRQSVGSAPGSSSVAQTENAIQNIILEEMEKLDGIMIATTNLIDNLDPAFERRFLFKIRFNNPTVEAKQSIWKSKLDWLSDEESRVLAERYNFSGGEIDNVVRKITMSEVLDGARPDLAGIEELCRHEKIGGKESGGIGFKSCS